MVEYHKYVFDTKNRKFVGQFEEMYQSELKSNFDSWHQEDSRRLNRKIGLAILDQWNDNSIIDIGAGKGALTHLSKKQNNTVAGIDISATAVEIANSRYPDIEFTRIDANDIDKVRLYLTRKRKYWGDIDLIFSSECLSYLKNWKMLIKLVAENARSLLVSLYVPVNPIGYVQTFNDLEVSVGKYCDIIE